MLISADFTLTTRPAFIALEGINGCGKSTLHRLLSQRLSAAGHRVCDTREPGGTPLGVELRRLLLDWRGEQKSARAELLLFAADRAEHVEKVIKPSLAQGVWVITDRFMYSTITFQGHGRGLPRSLIDDANKLAVQDTLPDLVVLLDLSPQEALQRLAGRSGGGRDAFEDEELSFHNRIREGFLECARESSAPFLVVDAKKTPEQICEAVVAALGIS